MPLIIGIVMSFAVDFLRQKVPALERRVCALHVRAVRNGEAYRASSWLRRIFRRGHDTTEEEPLTSAPQLAAQMALALALLLPYVLGVGNGKVRSSLISCWLGVGCMLAVQLGITLRGSSNADGSSCDEASILSPKHREHSRESESKDE